MPLGRPKKGFGLVYEEVPESTIRLAAKRTAPHLHNMRLVEYNLQQLIANCYMQGVRDVTETLVNRGWLVIPEEGFTDYQI